MLRLASSERERVATAHIRGIRHRSMLLFQSDTTDEEQEWRPYSRHNGDNRQERVRQGPLAGW